MLASVPFGFLSKIMKEKSVMTLNRELLDVYVKILYDIISKNHPHFSFSSE